MLALSRNIGQTICIGDDIKLTVLSVDGYQVKVGIDAPKDVTILRSELIGRDTPSQIDQPPKKPLIRWKKSASSA